MYMPTDIHSWVYIPAWGLGMLTFMIYEHTVSGFSHINMLAYVLTHAHTHISFMHVSGDWAFFIMWVTNLHLEGMHPCPRIRHAHIHDL